MARALKPHVIVKRWTVGGFQKERHLKCRCGWRAEHYNAGHLTELFKAHKDDAEAREGGESANAERNDSDG